MRRVAVLAVLAACPLLAVAGCGGGGSNAAPASSSTSASPTASSSAGSKTGPMPSASGAYGDKPTLTFPAGEPGGTLRSKVLTAGTGAEVRKGELLVADYLGQVWDGKVFDNSYDRRQPAAFQIGVRKVIPGWDETLVGVTAGSRVLLVIPPDKGYGSQGNEQAGIKGTDTLVFVVDVIRSFGKGAAGDPRAAKQAARTGGVHVRGELGERPTITVDKGTAPPKKPATTVLAKGTGPAVAPGLLVVQYEAVSWAGQSAGSTWQDGVPVGVPVGAGGQGASPFDTLVGVPVGSRVLITLPARGAADAAKSSVAAVVDIVAQPLPAKDTPRG